YGAGADSVAAAPFGGEDRSADESAEGAAACQQRSSVADGAAGFAFGRYRSGEGRRALRLCVFVLAARGVGGVGQGAAGMRRAGDRFFGRLSTKRRGHVSAVV